MHKIEIEMLAGMEGIGISIERRNDNPFLYIMCLKGNIIKFVKNSTAGALDSMTSLGCNILRDRVDELISPKKKTAIF